MYLCTGIRPFPFYYNYVYKLLSHIVHPYYFFSVESDFDPEQYTVFTSSVRTTSLTNLSPNTSYELRMTRIEGGGCTRRVTEIEGFETLGRNCLYFIQQQL